MHRMNETYDKKGFAKLRMVKGIASSQLHGNKWVPWSFWQVTAKLGGPDLDIWLPSELFQGGLVSPCSLSSHVHCHSNTG